MEIRKYTAPAAKVLNEQFEEDLYYSIRDSIDSTSEFFELKHETGFRNADYYASRQWTQEELDAHIRQYRRAYVFNEIRQIVDNIVGTENQTRMDSKILAREKGDEVAAECLTSIVKWCEQVNDLETIATEVFKDGIIKGYGAAVIRWSNEDVVHGYPKIEKIPFGELRWDINSKEINLKDSRWMARVQRVSRMDAYEMMP